jgi:hypothetical protein
VKIIIVGNWIWGQYEEAFCKALELLGHECIPFSTRRFFRGASGYFQEVIPFKGLSTLKLNKALLNFLENEKPDILFAWRCTHLLSSSLREINRRGIVTVSYNNDDPFGALNSSTVPWHHKYLWRLYIKNLKEFQINFFYLI